MSPVIKYTLGRFGLFAVVFLALSPVPMNLLIKLMVAVVASAAFSFLLLRKWRNEMAEQLASVARRRTTEKQRLRAALAGDESAAAGGDRAAADTLDVPPGAEATPPHPGSSKPAPGGAQPGGAQPGGVQPGGVQPGGDRAEPDGRPGQA